MASKYLDFVGLSRFLDKLKGLFAPKKQGVEYINGTQTASTNVWTGETSDNELYEGKMIAYRLPYAGTSTGATLDLTFANGTTSGAKNVYLSTSTRMTTHVAAGNTVILVYHEANVIGSTTYQGWWMDAYYNSDSSAGIIYISGSRGGHTITNCPPVCMFLTQAENRLLPTWAGTANSTAATHVMTTEEFDPFGRIYYKSSTAYNAGTLVGAAIYLTYTIDLRYLFNTSGFDLLDNGVGTTIYMVCKPTTNGKAVLHDDPITKTLPIEDDGLLYVYLGRSYSSTTIYLMLDHPVYMFDAEAGEAIAIDRSYLLDRDKNRIVTESDPYIYRQTGDGEAIGNIEVLDKIVGGTICWNQMLTDGDFPDNATAWNANAPQYGSVAISDGVLTLTVGSSVTTSLYARKSMGTNKLPNNHVILLSVDVQPSVSTTTCFLYSGIASGIRAVSVPANSWTNRAAVVRMVADGQSCPFYVNFLSELSTGDTVRLRNYHIHDLTQMFGSTIADYIYSLETATAGAGVEWFKRYFPNDYYAYNPGELISVTGLQEHKTVGKNLFAGNVVKMAFGDYTTGAKIITNDSYRGIFARAESGKTYTVSRKTIEGNRFRIVATINQPASNEPCVILGNASTLDETLSLTVTLPDGYNYIFAYLSNQSDPITSENYQIELGSTATDYEPYISHSTALDSNVTLRGIFSLDSANKLTSNGDIWTPDGKIERHYAEIDFGSLSWAHYSDTSYGNCFYAILSNSKYRFNGTVAGYTRTTAAYTSLDDLEWTNNSGAGHALFIRNDAYESATNAEFKSAMSGVKLVYELAEPIVEDAPAYSLMQKGDPAGTEEFVSNAEIKIPVGHSTRYMLAPKLYDETQSQLSAVRKAIEGEFVSAKNEQTFTPNQQLQARENIGATGIEYIRGTQTATTNAWTGVSKDTALYNGKIICYWLPAAGNSSSATLNLTMADGTTTGAVPVYWLSTTRVTTHQAQYSNWLYIYIEDYVGQASGTHYGAGWWSLNRAYYTDAYPSYACREYTPPKVKAALYRYMLCFSDVDTQLIPASDGNNNTGTTKNITTASFDPFGRIYYYNTTTAIAANARPGENTMLYSRDSLNIDYSFNTGATLTAQMPVYVACVPQSDGRVKFAENPIVQTIPLEDNGLIYIYLGQARTTSAICLNADHDIYKVYNGVVYNIKSLML